jgi:hypothetical protein
MKFYTPGPGLRSEPTMAEERAASEVVEAIDQQFPGPGVRRIALDASAQTVIFENCHWPRRFWSFQFDAHYVCRFDDILAAHDFGQRELCSVMIKTRQGRARMFADWQGYDALRDALQQIASAAPHVHWAAHPRMIPIYAAIFVVLLTWLLFLFT